MSFLWAAPFFINFSISHENFLISLDSPPDNAYSLKQFGTFIGGSRSYLDELVSNLSVKIDPSFICTLMPVGPKASADGVSVETHSLLVFHGAIAQNLSIGRRPMLSSSPLLNGVPYGKADTLSSCATTLLS